MADITIDLSEKAMRLAQSAVEDGGFATVGGYIESLIDAEASRRAAADRLDDMLVATIEKDRYLKADEAFWKSVLRGSSLAHGPDKFVM